MCRPVPASGSATPADAKPLTRRAAVSASSAASAVGVPRASVAFTSRCTSQVATPSTAQDLFPATRLRTAASASRSAPQTGWSTSPPTAPPSGSTTRSNGGGPRLRFASTPATGGLHPVSVARSLAGARSLRPRRGRLVQLWLGCRSPVAGPVSASLRHPPRGRCSVSWLRSLASLALSAFAGGRRG